MADWGIMDYPKLSKVNADGVETQGVVVDSQQKRNRRSTSYYLTVNYTPAGKSPIAKSFSVSSAYFTLNKAGHTCKVNDLANDPETAIIVGGSLDASIMLWIGSAIATVGLIGSVAMTVWKRKPAAEHAGTG